MRGLREIPHVEIVRIGSRVPVFLPQRIDDELCEMLAKYHPVWMNIHVNHPQRDHARAGPRLRQAVAGRRAAGQPVGAAGGRQRLRPHPARPRPEARRDPGSAVLHLPVRPGRGRRPLPDAGRQGPRDHRGPPRPHVRLRGAPVHRRRARRRREDPGHAELPDLVLGSQGRAPQLRGLHHHLRGADQLHAPRQGELPLLPEPAAGARPGGPHRAARRQADVDRAGRLRRDARARQRRGAPPPGPVEVGSLRRRRARGPGRPAARPCSSRGLGNGGAGTTFGPGEEPRPAEGQPTATANHELL